MIEFKKITQTKEDLRVTMKVGDHQVDKDYPYKQEILNDWVFPDLKTAIEYYAGVIVNNIAIVENIQKRLSQMPEGVEHLADFIAELKHKQSIGKTLSKNMDKVITVWENRQGFVKSLKDNEDNNLLIKQILEELKKLQ